MKKIVLRNTLSLALCAALVFTLLPTVALADAASYGYIDENGDQQTTSGSVTVIDSSWTGVHTLTAGWYVVTGSVSTDTITVTGDVHLILTDSAALTVTASYANSDLAGITVNVGNSLTIYGQSTGANMGTLEAVSGVDSTNGAGIGGNYTESAGTIIINGGKITADGNNGGGAGIGGGGNGGDGGTVTINGGVVTAYNNAGGAGIGGGQSNGGDGGTVTISGGTVKATGGPYGGAGIGGGGYGGYGGTVTISGGAVTATGGSSGGAGIGGGGTGIGGTVTISGGTVKATGGTVNAEAIGKGEGGASSGTLQNSGGINVYLTTITLNDETGTGLNEAAITSLTASLSGSSYDCGIHDMKTDTSGKLYLYLPAGDVDLQLCDGTYGYAASPTVDASGTTAVTANDLSSTCVNITEAGTYHLTQSSGTATTNTISINGESEANPVNITLNGVNIDTSAANVCAFDLYDFTYVELTLSGDNNLKSGDDYAGLHVPERATIFIDGGGTVTATGSSNLGGGAGIGGNYGERGGVIRINGGNITAQGGAGAAGIGGGKNGRGGSTTIDGGTIEAQGGTGGAGIGGGALGGGGTIQINGGQVTAMGGQTGAGIGGGEYRPGGDITISAGVVNAESESGAGIGGGTSGSGGDIAVSGGTITATSSGTGAGIGGGASGDGGNVYISGGSVKSTAAAAGGAEDIGYGSGGSSSGTLQNNSTDLAPVFLTTVVLPGVTAETAISSLTAILSGNDYAYGIEDMYTDSAGNLYLYLPTNASVTQVRTADTVYNNISGTFTADTEKPAVAGVTPSGTGVALSGNIVITFDEDMKTPQTGSVSLNGTLLAGGTWSLNNSVFTAPYSGLTCGTTYTVTVSGFADYSANVMSDDSAHSFTTMAASSSTTYYTITAAAGTGGSISPSGSASVAYGNDKTYTITANEGYEIEAVLVDGVSVGTVSTYTFENVKKAHTITVSFKKTELVNPFTDVTENDWFYNNVLYAYENGLMTGTASDAFNPNGTMTRAMAVTVLYRLSGDIASYTNYFSDVPSGEWYDNATSWAATNGIAGGFGDGRFSPNGSITREQLAVMLYRYAQFMNYDVSVGEDTNILSYNDAFDISDYAYSALQWACGEDIINGDTNGNLNPQGFATRAEVVAMLHRFIKSVATD